MDQKKSLSTSIKKSIEAKDSLISQEKTIYEAINIIYRSILKNNKVFFVVTEAHHLMLNI